MDKPIIGIVSKIVKDSEGRDAFFVNTNICEKIIINGAIPITLNYTTLKKYDEKVEDITVGEIDAETMQQIKLCDGIILQGGINYSTYEVNIAKYVLDNDIPVLGICAGMNCLIKAGGGNFRRDTNREIHQNRYNNLAAHKVSISKNSLLYDILKVEELYVNSVHTRTSTNTGIYEPIAYSEDGLVEAVELKNKKFNLGVQWHPEEFDINSNNNDIFKTFIRRCIK